MDEFRGLYISDEQVDALLAETPSQPPAALPPPLPALAAFDLDAAATALLLLALAPDAAPKYGTLIAYLNDDARRRWPTPDLAHRLFGPGIAAALAPDGPLFGPGLLLPFPDATPRQAFALRDFAANPVLASHLLGPAITTDFTVEPPVPSTEHAPLAAALAVSATPLVILTGSGRAEAVRALGRPVVRLALPQDAPAALRDAALAARLAAGILVLDPAAAVLPALAPRLANLSVPVFVLAPGAESWRPALAGCAALHIDCAPPAAPARQQLWETALRQAGLNAALAEAADRFRLTAAQITAAAGSIALATPPATRITTAALLTAARAQSASDLQNLAQRITTRQSWPDLILPETCRRQVQKFAAAIRHRDRVFTGWGFAGGPGLTALFGGGPGTGKTMSAGILAAEAGLDLWRIDLSAVVSKYIGETEKHLERIFTQARDGNAILFFDEADAIFGKRSEVKDAHDRYANIEVAYLLQRLESFPGIVILATNLARNIDPAFARRLHFVIDFPLPDAGLREALWRAALPPSAPRAENLDMAFIARQFAFAGGDIRVAALDAAFAAAADDAPIDMVHLLQAVGRQLLKQGKVPQGSDFGPYRLAVAETAPPQLLAAQ
jgi:AAA+ superfamily predicted ATPase